MKPDRIPPKNHGHRNARGFTLLEVMIALMLVGIGFAVALSAMSGSLRLVQRAAEHENAALLAKARLAEASTYPDYDLADDVESETYGGVEYSYRIEFVPVTLVDKKFQDKVKLATKLEEIRVTVFWGENASQSYTLSTFKSTADESVAGAGGNAAKPGDANAAQGQQGQQPNKSSK